MSNSGINLMNNKTLSSLFVLFAIVSIGMTAAPSAFAEHSMNATVENAQGSSTPGCEPDCFIPATVTIGVGGMVTFSNNDTAAHTSTAGTPADGPSGAWDSSLVMMNSAYTTPALDAGEYPYYCMVHPWMTGLIIVGEGAAPPSEPAPTEPEPEPVPTTTSTAANTVENAQGSSTPGCEPDCFIPATITINPGESVTFANNDSAAHTSTAGTPADGPSGAWDSSIVMMGSAYTTPGLSEGTYPYFCMVHPWMEGLVIVEEESHDDHGDGNAEEAEDHGDMKMEMQTLTAADISIDIADGAKAGEQVAIDVTISGEHVNYDIVATHNGETILDESGNHSHTGEGSHTTSALSADASDDNPIDVTVTFQGFGVPGEEFTGPIGLTNTAQAVPEFGAIAAVILAVAIVSIIAVSAKSRLSFMPRI